MARAKYSIQNESGFITLTLSGNFNQIDVKSYVKSIKQTVEKLQGAPFVILVDNRALLGATPEAYTESNAYNEWLTTQNVVGKAAVYPTNMLAHIDAKWVPAKQQIEYRLFERIDEAKQWLSTKMKQKSSLM